MIDTIYPYNSASVQGTTKTKYLTTLLLMKYN